MENIRIPRMERGLNHSLLIKYVIPVAIALSYFFGQPHMTEASTPVDEGPSTYQIVACPGPGEGITAEDVKELREQTGISIPDVNLDPPPQDCDITYGQVNPTVRSINQSDPNAIITLKVRPGIIRTIAPTPDPQGVVQCPDTELIQFVQGSNLQIISDGLAANLPCKSANSLATFKLGSNSSLEPSAHNRLGGFAFAGIRINAGENATLELEGNNIRVRKVFIKVRGDAASLFGEIHQTAIDKNGDLGVITVSDAEVYNVHGSAIRREGGSNINIRNIINGGDGTVGNYRDWSIYWFLKNITSDQIKIINTTSDNGQVYVANYGTNTVDGLIFKNSEIETLDTAFNIRGGVTATLANNLFVIKGNPQMQREALAIAGYNVTSPNNNDQEINLIKIVSNGVLRLVAIPTKKLTNNLASFSPKVTLLHNTIKSVDLANTGGVYIRGADVSGFGNLIQAQYGFSGGTWGEHANIENLPSILKLWSSGIAGYAVQPDSLSKFTFSSKNISAGIPINIDHTGCVITPLHDPNQPTLDQLLAFVENPSDAIPVLTDRQGQDRYPQPNDGPILFGSDQCISSAGEPTPTVPVPSSTPDATTTPDPTITLTPEATETPEPSATATPEPDSTPTTIPTKISSATATVTPTSTPSPTPTTVPAEHRLFFPLIQRNKAKAQLEKDERNEVTSVQFAEYNGVWQPVHYKIKDDRDGELKAVITSSRKVIPFSHGEVITVYKNEERLLGKAA